MQATQRVQGEEVVEKKLEDRTVIVVLRQGTATPHSAVATQASEIVQGVAKWTSEGDDQLRLYNAASELVASFRDWSFVKFMDPKK